MPDPPISVPVVTLDFTSMYAGVQTLMGLESFLVCEKIDAVEQDAAALMGWIASLSSKSLFVQQTWTRLRAICLVQPQAGDIFPMRARWGGKESPFGIGVNSWAETPAKPLWYTLPDVVASFILSRQVPTIVRAIGFEPHGERRYLPTVKLRGEAETSLDGHFFARAVERRAALPEKQQKHGLGRFLKVMSSATSYGIFAQMTRSELTGRRTEPIRVHGLTMFTTRTRAPEAAGDFFFAPTAALVTGGARLMLALLEAEVSARGGAYAFADTDSMAIVAARKPADITIEGIGADGSSYPQTIHALSWGEVDAIVETFDQLKPYSDVVTHLLKIEKENFANGRRRQIFAHAISAKRYALYTLDRTGRPRVVSVSDAGEIDDEEHSESDDMQPVIVKRSEHGLGHLLNPLDPESEDTDWIRDVWQWVLETDLGFAPAPPPWFDLPAVSRTSVSTPAGLRTFAGYNTKKSQAEKIRPFNFLLTCYPDPQYSPRGEGRPFRLVSPYERDPSKWISANWYETHTGEPYRITTYGTGSAGTIRVKTYGEVVAEYLVHPETKAAGPDGKPCGKRTRGVLQRRAVRMAGMPKHVGKESNKLDERARDEVEGESDYLNVYELGVCGCGCGQEVTGRQRYVNNAHKMRAFRSLHKSV